MSISDSINQSHGFTLLELLIAIALLSLLFAVGGASLSKAARDGELRFAAEQFSADIIRARIESILKMQSINVVIDETIYEIQELSIQRRLPYGAKIRSITGYNHYTFRPGGIISGEKFLLNMGQAEYIVEIAPVTGEVSVRK